MQIKIHQGEMGRWHINFGSLPLSCYCYISSIKSEVPSRIPGRINNKCQEHAILFAGQRILCVQHTKISPCKIFLLSLMPSPNKALGCQSRYSRGAKSFTALAGSNMMFPTAGSLPQEGTSCSGAPGGHKCPPHAAKSVQKAGWRWRGMNQKEI